MKIFITGASSGIGLEMAKQLSLQGHAILFTARTKEKGSSAKEQIQQFSGNRDVQFLTADLGSQKEVKRCIKQLHDLTDHIHIVIFNAGVFYDHFALTGDGLETSFAVNHLAGFMITLGIMGLLKRAGKARIIITSSDMHYRISFLDFQKFSAKRNFQGAEAYATTKLCNVLFCYALSEKLKDSRITVNVHHPGIVKTDFVSKHTSLLISAGWQFIKLNGVSVKKGAETGIYLASSNAVEDQTGLYWEKMRTKASSQISYNQDLQKSLWDFSERATGFQFT